MSYALHDSKGYVDEFGSVRFLVLTRQNRHCPPAVQKFLETEKATKEEVDAMVAEIDAAKPSPILDGLKAIGRMLRKSEPPIRLDDGANDP